MDKESALNMITLSVAEILGISDRTGSLEVGKDATIVISLGDLLDMITANVTHEFIEGKKIDLNNRHKMLNEKYKQKD